MVSADEARRIALALPDAVELDHHGKPSFRVRGKIFATLWAAEELNVMLDEPGILTVVQAHPDLCREVWWGKKRAAAKIDLARATPAFVGELLADAYEHKSGRS